MVESKQRWRKLLYIRQPFLDNFVDRRFLKELCKNSTVRFYDFKTLFLLSTAIIQHLASLAIFASTFIYAYHGQLGAGELVYGGNVLTAFGYLIWMVYIRIRRRSKSLIVTGKQTAKSAILFLMILLAMSPILKTLTEDLSRDTIWALSILCFLFNAIFTDYSFSRTPDEKLSPESAIALNAAFLGSIMLASRLATKTHVFGFLSMTVNWFGLLPNFRQHLRIMFLSSGTDVFLTLLFIVLAFALLQNLSMILSIVFLIIILIIWTIGPFLYVTMQSYKNEIRGPWDEATIQN